MSKLEEAKKDQILKDLKDLKDADGNPLAPDKILAEWARRQALFTVKIIAGYSPFEAKPAHEQ